MDIQNYEMDPICPPPSYISFMLFIGFAKIMFFLVVKQKVLKNFVAFSTLNVVVEHVKVDVKYCLKNML